MNGVLFEYHLFSSISLAYSQHLASLFQVPSSGRHQLDEALGSNKPDLGDEVLIANEGAKVLHNRCIEVGQKYHVPIITKSTFNNKPGTLLQDRIEDTNVKSIVKNDDIKGKRY